jgi:hypothetical protein
MATPTSLPASWTSGQVLTAASLNNLRGAFRILQVATVTKTDSFTTTSATFTDITGLSVSITPSATSSQILVLMSLQGNAGVSTGDALSAVQLVRGATSISVGDAAGNRWQATASLTQPEAYNRVEQLDYTTSAITIFLDSPATVAATTYKVQGRVASPGTLAINRSVTDTNLAGYVRTASTLTVLEVSA